MGDKDGCAFWIAMTGADCGDELPGEEGVVVEPTIIVLFRRFLLPPRGLRLS